MTDQLRMNQAGELEPDQPRSWDGEPLYCADTVREGLFDPSAFEQMPGQLAMDDAPIVFTSMLGSQYSGYQVVDRQSGRILAGPFARNVDAFNAARELGPLASVREI